jgi:hypothetical protein
MGLHPGARFIGNLPLTEPEEQAAGFVLPEHAGAWFFKMNFLLLLLPIYTLNGFPIENGIACRL